MNPHQPQPQLAHLSSVPALIDVVDYTEEQAEFTSFQVSTASELANFNATIARPRPSWSRVRWINVNVSLSKALITVSQSIRMTDRARIRDLIGELSNLWPFNIRCTLWQWRTVFIPQLGRRVSITNTTSLSMPPFIRFMKIILPILPAYRSLRTTPFRKTTQIRMRKNS